MTTPIDELRHAIDRLRSAGGCPWDGEQNHRSLLPYLIEESHEYVEAVETGDRDHMVEELGDVLWQVVFHARLGEEDDEPFDFDEIATALLHKVVSRHPHVFDDESPDDVGIEWVEGAWEKIKAAEKADRESVFDGIPATMPALSRAQKVVRKIDRAGLDVGRPGPAITESAPAEPSTARAATRAAPSAPGDEQIIGEDLLKLVREAEHRGIDAESALRCAVRELEAEARAVESHPDVP